jgi:hypothetical protein
MYRQRETPIVVVERRINGIQDLEGKKSSLDDRGKEPVWKGIQTWELKQLCETSIFDRVAFRNCWKRI